MAKFEGRGACNCCGKSVDVYSDKGGLAYYNCGPCGVRVLHKNRRTSDAFLSRLDREAEPEEGPVEPPAAKPAPAPSPAPRVAVAPPAVPPKVTPPPAPAKRASFLSNFHLG